MSDRIGSFGEFWPHYVREHARPLTRGLHYVGTAGLLVVLAIAGATGRWVLLALLPVVGYGFAWTAHFFVEKNRPATFKHPLWSFAGDWKMWGLMLTGRLQAHLDRFGITPKAPTAKLSV